MKCALIAVLAIIALIMTCAKAAPATIGKPWNTTTTSGTKIVGGAEVSIDDYNNQVSLTVNGKHICGGTIISDNYVVTAAHCVVKTKASALTVRVGSTFRSTGGTVHNIVQIIVHTSYKSRTSDYDIALLKVKPSFVFSATINKVALPTPNSAFAAGLGITVSGWGTMNSGATTLPDHLMAVSIPVVSQASCQTSYGASSITPRMLCAGLDAGGKDSCQGDSGGPLVADAGGVRQLIGVVSWGNGCAEPNYPGVYTNVSSLVPWIKAKTGI